jgi:hypothetical protein
MRIRNSLSICAALTVAVTSGFTISAGNAAEATSESDTERLAKETQNPIANLISVPFQNNSNFGIGPSDATQVGPERSACDSHQFE